MIVVLSIEEHRAVSGQRLRYTLSWWPFGREDVLYGFVFFFYNPLSKVLISRDCRILCKRGPDCSQQRTNRNSVSAVIIGARFIC